MQRSPESLSERAFNRPAYSRAAAGSWREHGPQTTSRRSFLPIMISIAWKWSVSDFRLKRGRDAHISAALDHGIQGVFRDRHFGQK